MMMFRVTMTPEGRYSYKRIISMSSSSCQNTSSVKNMHTLTLCTNFFSEHHYGPQLYKAHLSFVLNVLQLVEGKVCAKVNGRKGQEEDNHHHQIDHKPHHVQPTPVGEHNHQILLQCFVCVHLR